MKDGARLAMPAAVWGLAVAAIVAGVRVVLRLPGIPYNLRELFLDHASTSALVFFSLTLLWIGAGARLVAQAAARSRRPFVAVPFVLVLVCVISKMLLSRSVTYESVDDIIGSDTLFGMVTRGNAWGAFWARAFDSVGGDAIDFLERRVRYAALYSIPLTGIASMLGAFDASVRSRFRREPLAMLPVAVIAVLWLWLARTIVVPWAGTDNLTELLPRQPPLGIGGEWYLFAISMLIGVNVALLLRGMSHGVWLFVAAMFALAALPAGWLLLNLGLEPRVEKYGAVFSGVQFLLGPDRTHTLTPLILFVRWGVLQLGAVAVTFVGAWITDRFLAAAVGVTTSAGSRSNAAASSRPHVSPAPD